MMKKTAAWTGRVTNAEPTQDGIKVTVKVDAAANHGLVRIDRLYYMSPKGDKDENQNRRALSARRMAQPKALIWNW
jgi:hypothetical protein